MNIFREIDSRWRGRDEAVALSIRLDSGEYRDYAYGRLLDRIGLCAEALRAVRAEPGDRVALAAENSPEWIAAFLAVSKLECTAVLIDPSLGETAAAELIEKADPVLVMASPKTVDLIRTSLPVFDILGAFFAGPGPLDPRAPRPPGDGDPSLAAILFSSGTTSTAKGVMHRHDALLAMARRTIDRDAIVASDRFLAVIPLCHIYGLMSGLLCPLLAGAGVRFLESPSGESLLAAFREYRPTGFAGVPRIFDLFKARVEESARSRGTAAYLLFRLLLASCSALRRSFGVNPGRVVFASVHDVFGGTVRGFLSGGAYLAPSVVRFFHGLGFYLLNNYGLTETGIPVAANSLSYFTTDSCGEMFEGVTVKIGPAEDGAGEILVRSVGMMAGYFRDEAATMAAFEDGWFRTGDRGYLDGRGNLVVTGRTKENIVLATGKKVAPDDVEKAYGKIAGIAELVVCGVASGEDAAEEIHCFVVKDRDPSKGEGEIREDIAKAGAALPAYMRIGTVHFVESIPRTALQKPKRYLLARLAAEERSRNSPETRDAEGAGRGAFDTVRRVAARLRGGDRAVVGSTRLVEDLGFDSLTVTEFLAVLRKTTGVDLFDILKPNLTVGDAARALEERLKSPRGARCDLRRYPAARRSLDALAYRSVAALSNLAYRVVVEGAELLPRRGGYLLCPNHQSHLDGLWVLMQLPEEQRRRFCSMAKKEHLDTLLGRLLLRVAGGIPVDRFGNPAPAYERCLEKLEEGWIVLVHPEGTRTSDGKIGPFKHGAAKLSIESGAPIVPVRISGAFEIFPRTRVVPRLFDLRNGGRYELRLSFGGPIAPEGEGVEALTRKLAEAVDRL